MTFMEADAKLAEIAQGRYRALLYEMVTHSSGEVSTVCRVYASDKGWHEGPTWDAAFSNLMTNQIEQPPEVEA